MRINHTYQAVLRPPSTSKIPLQLNQSSPAFTCPPEDRRCTPNQDRKLIRDNPKIRRSLFTFAAHLGLRNSTRQTGARVLRASDNFSSQAFGYTAHDSMRRKRAGLSPVSDSFSRSATVNLPPADCISGYIPRRCAARFARGLRVSPNAEAAVI